MEVVQATYSDLISGLVDNLLEINHNICHSIHIDPNKATFDWAPNSTVIEADINRDKYHIFFKAQLTY